MRTKAQMINDSNVKALKRTRVLKGLSRSELAQKLSKSSKWIEKYENGREFLSEAKIKKILDALNVSRERFLLIKKGKSLNTKRGGKEKKVLTNNQRRSYQKIITKECIVLKSMRRIKKIPQDRASKLCGYPRATIGHIENGRIELKRKRIELIVKAYGYKMYEFNEFMEQENLRDEIIDRCNEIIEILDDRKLDIVKNLLESF